MTLSLPTGFRITELSNIVVADSVCEDTLTSWASSYRIGQDFHLRIDVPDPASEGEVYGLNQTLLLAIRTGLYVNEKGDQTIQLWRTPPQQGTKFDFKGNWLDTESADDEASSNSIHPYYSNEAVAKTEARTQGTEEKETAGNRYSVTLRMRKIPTITMPTQIRRKSNPDEKLTIKQLDVQEYRLISLFRDEDVKDKQKDGNEGPNPLIQWTWEYKCAWGSTADGKPLFEPRPGFANACTLVEDRLMSNFRLRGPNVMARGTDDYFRVLSQDYQGGEMGEASEWETEMTDEWEACDV